MDYVLLAELCFGRGKMRAKEKAAILRCWCFDKESKAFDKMGSDDLTRMLVDMVRMSSGPGLMDELHATCPSVFAMPYASLRALFSGPDDRLPEKGQVEYLSRHGYLTVLSEHKSRTDGVTMVRCYDPFEIEALPDDCRDVPDIPDMLTEADIKKHFGWTSGMVSKYLLAPELTPNPRYLTGPKRRRWYAGDVERMMRENDDVKAYLAVMAAKRASRGTASSRKGAARNG